MWNGKMKAVTFSYDDGVCQDRRLVELFNRYRVKATFNLNSGIQSGGSSWNIGELVIKRMNIRGLKELYAGHEIAVHGLTHASLTKLDEEAIYNEIYYDKKNLEEIFEYRIQGMAYPYGDYNEQVKRVLKECGIRYARTVDCAAQFDISADLLELQATGHHGSKNLIGRIKEFLAMEAVGPQLLYIWGHSYEFDTEHNWELMEQILRLVSGKDEIYYGTNAEVLL